MSEKFHQEKPEKFHFFRPKTDLEEIRAKIKQLQKKSEKKRLRFKEEKKLKELKSITRREFLKKAGLVVGGAAVAGGILKGRDLLKESIKEKIEPALWAKSLIKEYNDWLSDLKSEEIEKVDAQAKFIEIYNQKRSESLTPFELPPIKESLEKPEEIETFLKKLNPLFNFLEEKGYFFRCYPTVGTWRGKTMHFVAAVLGKIIQKEKKEIHKKKQKANYEHIIIDTFDPDEEGKDYFSRPFDISAMTLKEENRIIILQLLASYKDSAKRTYNDLGKPHQTEIGLVREKLFGQYKELKKSEAILHIQNIYFRNSLYHEEQHVLDKMFTEQEAEFMTGEKLSWWLVGEARGVISPLCGTDPKAALLSIYSWQDSGNPLKEILTELTTSILRDVSSKELKELSDLPDLELNQIGEKAIGATDILYDFVIKQGKRLTHPQVQEEFNKYIEGLRRKD